jgi:hypothetical protein
MRVHKPTGLFLVIVILVLCISSIANFENVIKMIPELYFPSESPVTGAPADTRGIAYVTFSHLINRDTSSFTNFIFPSIDTWIPEGNYFVVLGEQWRENYYTYVCPESNDGEFTKYCDRIIPIFVECPEGYAGESPCCKNEKGMLFFVDHPEIFRSYNWFMFMDADDYVRRDYIEKFVADIDPSHAVIAASGRNLGWNSQLGKPSFAHEGSNYHCSNEPKFMYPWGQPVMYSRQALLSMQNGFRLRGLTKQCMEFDVTHDVGNAIFHWMYQIPNVRMPWPMNPDVMKNTSLGAHAVGRTDFLNFSQLHEKIETGGIPIENVAFAHEWNTEFAFHETETYKKFGDPRTWTKTWHTMGVEGCRSNVTGSDGGPYEVPPQPWVRFNNGSWTA